MQIEQRIIERAMEPYLENFRWLREARLETREKKSTCYGTFRINSRTYTKDPHFYLGCPEAIITLNQIAYVAWAQLIHEGIVKAGMNLEEFLGLPGENMNMAKISRLRFTKPMRTDADFPAQISLEGNRENENWMVAMADFDIGNGSCCGKACFGISPNPRGIYTRE
jgi:hypothetical protein